jgi:hypothetical protein
MPIQNDEELFAALCSLFKIQQIYEILNISDAQIRSVCTAPELAQLVIDLKEETMKQIANRLVQRRAAVGSTTRSDPSDLRCRLQRFNY